MTRCPQCNQNTLAQSMRADVCLNEDCNYSEGYADAYATVDPRGDFDNAYELS